MGPTYLGSCAPLLLYPSVSEQIQTSLFYWSTHYYHSGTCLFPDSVLSASLGWSVTAAVIPDPKSNKFRSPRSNGSKAPRSHHPCPKFIALVQDWAACRGTRLHKSVPRLTRWQRSCSYAVFVHAEVWGGYTRDTPDLHRTTTSPKSTSLCHSKVLFLQSCSLVEYTSPRGTKRTITTGF